MAKGLGTAPSIIGGERAGSSKQHSRTSLVVLAIAVALAAAIAACAPATSTPLLTQTSPPPTPAFGSTLVSLTDGVTQVYVPEGSFTMGSEVGLTDEQPVHTVFLDAYWIDQTEVTHATYSGGG